jgi:hypothetical protein
MPAQQTKEQRTFSEVIQAGFYDAHCTPCQACILCGADLLQLLAQESQAGWQCPVKQDLKVPLGFCAQCFGQRLQEHTATV